MIRVNGLEVSGDFDTVASLVDSLRIETRGVAVAVNGDVVRRGDWDVTALVDGDAVEIVNAAAGG
ncbi:MAG: sulfur carrier protein ThiS [Acidimicrobiales bacterium]